MSNEKSAQLRNIAGQIISGDALDSFVEYALIDAFTTEDGEIDQEKVKGHLTAIYAAGQPQHQQQRNRGKQTGYPPGQRPGDNARAALKARFGVENTVPASQDKPGDVGRAELEKRHGPGKIPKNQHNRSTPKLEADNARSITASL